MYKRQVKMMRVVLAFKVAERRVGSARGEPWLDQRASKKRREAVRVQRVKKMAWEATVATTT